MALSGKVDWVWVDCFTHFPLTGAQGCTTSKSGLALCRPDRNNATRFSEVVQPVRPSMEMRETIDPYPIDLAG